MTASLTLTRFTGNVPATRGHLVACCPPTAADALSGQCQVPEPTTVSGRRAATGTSASPSGRAGADDYEIRVTLRVDAAYLEEAVAHSFANPYCVDIQVQSPTIAQGTVEEGRAPRMDDQASGRARSSERPRPEGHNGRPTARFNEWDEV